VFEHLAREPDDFAGAFTFVGSRLRLIHLYAWQSHLWNRTVTSYVREITPRKDLLWVDALEGRLAFARGALPMDADLGNNWRLPGPRMEDITHPRQRELYTKALELEDVRPEGFSIEGVSGFQLKGEDRDLLIRPRKLRHEPDGEDRDGFPKLRLCFELPRGSYATMVLARLFPNRSEKPYQDSSDFGPGRPAGQRNPREDGPRRRSFGDDTRRRDSYRGER
jgi:tRNA pseudouridine13 synthase